MFICSYLSLGYLVQSMDYFEQNDMELTDETESSEKEVKEDIDNDEFMNAIFIRNFLFQTILFSSYIHSLNWNPEDQDILTPPPES
jgi:hypothetical protein